MLTVLLSLIYDLCCCLKKREENDCSTAKEPNNAVNISEIT